MKHIFKKAVIFLLILSINAGMLGGCGAKSDEPIQLTVYCKLANYSGKQNGWFAKILRDRFNVELTIVPETDGAFDTRIEAGDLGDIIIFSTSSIDDYYRAVSGGYLFDWNEDELLQTEGPYIYENMQAALNANLELTKEIYERNGIEKEPTIFGLNQNVATSASDHSGFIYTWDIRWDLYKELGYPQITDLDDYYDLLVSMKEICPTDESGNPTYAFSMWPDWDGHMMMYAKCLVTTYWGYEGDFGVGLFDTQTGNYYKPIDEESHYFDALRYLNKLYRAELIDPNSMTQTMTEAGEKMLNGGCFASIFSYAGSSVYNTKEHQAENKMMPTLAPEEAVPLAYGMSLEGSGATYAIGVNTRYPELCMEIINWLATPEGFMTYTYGPEAEYNEETGEYDPEGCWYIKDGHSYFTELGASAYASRKKTEMPQSWGGGTYQDGVLEMTAATWNLNSTNPLTDGETYNATYWVSRLDDEFSDIEADWREKTGARTANEYMNQCNYVVNHSTANYAYAELPDELKVIISQLDDCVTNYSWKAVYASSEEECEKILSEMVEKYNSYDPEDVVHLWYLDEAAKVYEIELSKSGRNE